jgi:hypothetical protein
MEPRCVDIMEKTPGLPNSHSRLRPPKIFNHKMRINLANSPDLSVQVTTEQRENQISFCHLITFVRNSSSIKVAVSNLPTADTTSSLTLHSCSYHTKNSLSYNTKTSFRLPNTPSGMEFSSESPSRLPRLAPIPNPCTPQSVPRHRPSVS